MVKSIKIDFLTQPNVVIEHKLFEGMLLWNLN